MEAKWSFLVVVKILKAPLFGEFNHFLTNTFCKIK